jgi:predicted O-methyltransferase YrrM
VALDVTYGNMTAEEATRLNCAIFSEPDLAPHEAGSTEPWVSQLVSDFIVARGARSVLETGCFKGATSVWIYEALRRLGGGLYVAVEVDEARRLATRDRIAHYIEPADTVRMYLYNSDVLHYLAHTADRFDLAWVDDCHEKPHVTKELMLLMPKMNKGGLILLHDVFGVCDLKTVVQQFGGYSIDLPRLGPAGGLGIIQC